MSGGDDRWFELINAVYQHRSKLVTRFIAEMPNRSDYENSGVTMEDLRGTAHRAFESILRYIVDGNLPDFRIELARDLGHRRARQHVPVEALSAAITTDFRVIWGLLRDLSTRQDDTLLTANVESLWEAVNGFARASQEEYHLESIRMARDLSDERRLLLERFLGVSGATQQMTNSVAAAFGFDTHDRFCVCCGRSNELLRSALPRMTEHSRKMVFGRADPDVWMLFWPADLPTGPGHPLEELRGISCGYLNDVITLQKVPESLQIVRGFIQSVPMDMFDEPVDVERNWDVLASSALQTSLPEIQERMDQRLECIRPAERERVLETVVCYLATGDIQETAQSSYCHRNTVLNRIRTFEEVTLLDLRLPKDLALAYLCFLTRPRLVAVAHSQLGDSSESGRSEMPRSAARSRSSADHQPAPARQQ